MRFIFICLICLGALTIALGIFQRVEEVARWSQIYAMMDGLQYTNQLRNADIRKDVDALYSMGTRRLNPVEIMGGLIFLLSTVGYIQHSRSMKAKKKAQQAA